MDGSPLHLGSYCHPTNTVNHQFRTPSDVLELVDLDITRAAVQDISNGRSC